MYNQEGDATEPEWVKTEREQFTEFRDKNKDGKMDKDETRDWILPSDYDHAEAEAKHLVYESDTDKVRTVKLKISTEKYCSSEFYSLTHSLNIVYMRAFVLQGYKVLRKFGYVVVCIELLRLRKDILIIVRTGRHKFK